MSVVYLSLECTASQPVIDSICYAGWGPRKAFSSLTQVLRFFLVSKVILQFVDSIGRQTLLTFNDREFNTLPFSQTLKALALNRGMMDENIAPFITRDEAITFLIVKPLHYTCFPVVHLSRISFKHKTLTIDICLSWVQSKAAQTD